MRKFTIYNLKFIIIFLVAFYILHFTFYIPIFAQEATTSSKEATPSGSVLDKLKTLKDEIASRASQIKLEVNKKLQNKAIAGSIKEIKEDQIILTSLSGDKTILINEYTEYLDKGKKFKFSNLEEKDYVVALGDMDDKNNLVAKKIEYQSSAPLIKHISWGQVQSVSGNIINLKLKDDQKLTVYISSNTSYYLGPKESSLSQVGKNTFVVITGNLREDKSLRASFVYTIPTGGVLKTEKSATPSATPR